MHFAYHIGIFYVLFATDRAVHITAFDRPVVDHAGGSKPSQQSAIPPELRSTPFKFRQSQIKDLKN